MYQPVSQVCLKSFYGVLKYTRCIVSSTTQFIQRVLFTDKKLKEKTLTLNIKQILKT